MKFDKSPWCSNHYTRVKECFSFMLRSHWELSSDGMCWLHFRKTARFVVKTCIKYRYLRLLSEQRIALSCHFPWSTHLGTSFEENIGNVFGLIVNDNQNQIIKWKHFPRYWPFVRGIHRWPVNSPHNGRDAELWCFLWSEPKQTAETPAIGDAIVLIMTSLWCGE